jgi:hypothetical protein
MANRLGRLLSEIHYCYQCFEWVVGEKWEPHCQAHLDALTSKQCGSVIHCHTLVHPGYCPFCVGKKSLPASERLKPWSRDHKLWMHVKDEHLTDCQWPLMCPYPLCNTSHNDPASFQFYLIDVHKFSRSRPTKGTSSTRQQSPDKKILPEESVDGVLPGQKRKSSHCSGTLSWMPPQSLDSVAAIQEEQLAPRPPKRKKQRSTPTIYPEVIVIDEDVSDDHTAQSAVESIMLSPPAPISIQNDDKSINLECRPFPSYYQTPNETICSLNPADFDDDSNLDILFDQYLRSPSLSPPPSSDGAASELSGATLIDVERDHSRGSTGPYMETLGSLAPEDELESKAARGQGICHLRNGPRIRLRVSQPKITLRFKFHDTCQSEKKKRRTMREVERQGTKSEKEKKGTKRGKEKRKQMRRT